MASVSVAFVVYKKVTLTISNPRPLDWFILNVDGAGNLSQTMSAKLELAKAGTHKLVLQPGVYGVIAPSEGSKPAIDFSFSTTDQAVALFRNKSDKDPWPVPPPPPPPGFEAVASNVWKEVTWRSVKAEDPVNLTSVEKAMFLAVGAADGETSLRYQIFVE